VSALTAVSGGGSQKLALHQNRVRVRVSVDVGIVGIELMMRKALAVSIPVLTDCVTVRRMCESLRAEGWFCNDRDVDRREVPLFCQMRDVVIGAG